MPEPVSVATAALQLGRRPSTVRRWIAQGAPTVALGKEGRGNGSLVDVAALQRWRARASADVCTNDADAVQRLAVLLWNVFKRDAGVGDSGFSAHRLLGIREHQAAAYLAHIFQRAARDWTGSDSVAQPDEIKNLIALIETAHK